MRAWFVLALGVGAAGCYRYSPITDPEPLAGQAVQVQLTPEGTRQIAPLYGPGIVQLDARLAAVQADTLRLLLRTGRTLEGVESYFRNDTLSLGRGAIASVSARKLALGPTAILGGLVVAGTLAGASMLSGDAGTGSQPGGGSAGKQ